MTLLDRCRHEFDPQSCQCGMQLYAAGSVSLSAPQGNQFRATVSDADGSEYLVEVSGAEARGGVLSCSCTCPGFADGDTCEHLWATLQKIAADGWSASIPGKKRLYIDVLESESDPWLNNDDEQDDELMNVIPASFREFLAQKFGMPIFKSVSKKPKKKKGAAKVPTGPKEDNRWRDALNQVQNTSQRFIRDLTFDSRTLRAEEHQEVYYVVNVSASFRENSLMLQFMQRERRQTGEFGKIKKLAVTRTQTNDLPCETDRALLHQLIGAKPLASTTSSHYSTQPYYDPYGNLSFSFASVPPTMYGDLLPRLCATGRCFWILDEPNVPDLEKPLRFEEGEPWRLHVQIESHDAEQRWEISGSLTRGDQSVLLTDAVLSLSDGIVLFQDCLARLDTGGDFGWIDVLRRNHVIQVPYAKRDDFVAALSRLSQLPRTALPENLQYTEVRVAPRAKLVVKPYKGFYRTDADKVMAQVSFLYDDVTVNRDQKTGAIADRQSGRLLIRDRDAEARLLTSLFDLQKLGVKAYRDSYSYYATDKSSEADIEFPRKALGDVVHRLVKNDWQVETDGKLMRRPGAFEFSVTSGVDWFELQGEFDFGGVKAELPDLLKALRDGHKFVTLQDGSQGLLPDEWLKKYGRLASLGDAQQGRLRFSTAQGVLLDALVAAQPEAKVDRNFAEFRQKLRSFEGVAPHDPPPAFTGHLREYQREGLGWLHFLRDFRFGGCLADDMGLGKTVQVLALLEARRTRELPSNQPHHPSLVVVPKSLVFNWIEEAKRFAPQLRVLDYTGTGRHDFENLEQAGDIVLTTYGTLRKDIIKLKDIRFDYAILDESQAIKNSASQSAKACRLIQADHRLAMTGTPVENHLGELWSLFEFLNPGLLGSSGQFDALSRLRGDEDRTQLELLAHALRPYILRRTKKQVLTELPEKTEQTIHCELSEQERQQYNELRDYYRTKLTKTVAESGFAKSKMHVLEALLRLRQVACHPGLLDKKRVGESSAKLEALLEQISEVVAEGHKALVFSQFTSLLSIVRTHLDKQKVVYEYLDGRTRDRQARVERFQSDPQCPLFLISLKAGGHGLNLTAADYVFILDPWWNPAVEAQAVDRAHRMGQTQHVFAYRLIAKDTVEEKILELQATKRDLADAIISADNSVLRNLTAEDLERLLN